MKKIMTASVCAVALASVGVFAAVTFDPPTGTGFVGKGDVQLLYGWNNKQLQDNASSVQFQASTVEVTESTWTCDRDAGPQTLERANTTTTTTQGVVSHIARERNQITGFILLGYDGDPVVETELDGPAVGSCPAGWTAIDLVEGDPAQTAGGLQVSIDGSNWFDLQ
jgi:opacity protein-like surface antigen